MVRRSWGFVLLAELMVVAVAASCSGGTRLPVDIAASAETHLSPGATNPEGVWHVRTHIVVGSARPVVRAEVRVTSIRRLDARDAVISIVRDASGQLVQMDPSPFADAGALGGVFIPRPGCEAGTVCDDAYTVTLRPASELEGTLAFYLRIDYEPEPVPSGAAATVTISTDP